ncbi:MAG: type I 3-dehydroquinate dehydratase [Verrucomicrobiales bacterium]|nr:type I 3-dehydroquinate dehydratase [Akkermansiaceae bacterium]
MDLSPASRLTVATVHHPDDLVLLREHLDTGRPLPAEVLEFRLDSFLHHGSQVHSRAMALLPGLKEHCSILGTARCKEEGGSLPLDVAARRDLLVQSLEAGAAAIDIEVRSLESLHDVVAKAKSLGIPVVASFHDFEGTPPFYRLRDQIEKAVAGGATVVKLAVRVESMIALFGLVSLFQQGWPVRISAMGMGSHGKLSRLVLAKAGSVLNYGYLREPNAPGQWPAGELRRLIAEI